MTFLVASMTYCFLKFAVLRIVSPAIATIALFNLELATGQWFSPVSTTSKTDHNDIAETFVK
jgi:hypothetical protein